MARRPRKIPVLNVNVPYGMDPDDAFNALGESPDVWKVVMSSLVEAIDEGVAKRKKDTPVFKINYSNQVITISKPQWSQSLEKAMNYYSQQEDWDMAIKCRDLIKKI